MNDPDPEVRWRAEFALDGSAARALKGPRRAPGRFPKIRWARLRAGALGKNAGHRPGLLNAPFRQRSAVRVWSVKFSATSIREFRGRRRAAAHPARSDPTSAG